MNEWIIDIILGLLVIVSYYYGYRFLQKEMISGIDGWLYGVYSICIFISSVFGLALLIDDIVNNVAPSSETRREVLDGWHTLLTGAMCWMPFLALGKKYPNAKPLTLIPLAVTFAGAVMLITKKQETWKIILNSFLLFQTGFMDICIWFFGHYVTQQR